MLYFKYAETKSAIIALINTFIRFSKHILNEIYLITKELKVIYPDISDVFTNRELAIGFLALLVITCLMFYKSTRESIIDLIKIMFSKDFVRLNLIMLLYLVLVTMLLIWIDFWELALLKSTIIWFITVGIVSVYKSINSAKDYIYFKSFVCDNIGIVILIEFVSNLYSFSFVKEVFLIILIIFISGLVAVIEVKQEFNCKEYKRFRNFFYMIIVGISIYWLFNSIQLLIYDVQNISVTILIKELVLPPIYSIFFVLIMYLLVIYAMYEVMFIRIGSKKIIDDEFRTYLKFRIILFCNFNIVKVNTFIERSGVLTTYVNSKQDVIKIIKSYKS